MSEKLNETKQNLIISLLCWMDRHGLTFLGISTLFKCMHLRLTLVFVRQTLYYKVTSFFLSVDQFAFIEVFHSKIGEMGFPLDHLEIYLLSEF